MCVLGTLSILMIGRAARRMFGSSLLGTIAAFLVAFEGHHFVQSRTGLLDLIVMFWALAAFCALLIDRDRSRALLAERAAGLSDHALASRSRAVARGPSVAVGGRHLPRPLRRHQVVGAVLPRWRSG